MFSRDASLSIGLLRKFIDLFDGSLAHLLGLLVLTGAWVGRNASTQFGGHVIFPNIFCVVIGERAVSRFVMNAVGNVLPLQVPTRGGGVNSGLALIHLVRDPLSRWERENTRPGDPPQFSPATVDGGMDDQRLLLLQSRMLENISRNTAAAGSLSNALLDAFLGHELNAFTSVRDGGFLRSTEAHIALFTDAVKAEVWSRHDLTRVCHFAPCPTNFEPVTSDCRGLRHELLERLNCAPGTCALSTVAEKVITDFTKLLPAHERNLAAVGIVKMALLFAIFDASQVIAREHAEAAIAVKRSSDETLRNFLKGADEEKIRKASSRIDRSLERNPDGLSGRQISRLFRNNLEGRWISEAKKLLVAEGRATLTPIRTKGRSRELWRLK